MVFRRKYATAATIHGVPLVTRGESDYKASPTLAAGDVKVSKDGGAFANIATLPDAHPAAGRSLRVQLSATEAEAARIVIQFVDQTSPKEWEDQLVIVETFGHASAQDDLTAEADALLKRDVDNVEATAAIHSLASAVLKLVSKFDGATGITYRTDGTTAHMTQAVTTDGDADPISALGVGA